MWSAQAWRQNSLFGKALETTAMQRPHASAGWISTLEARPSLIQGRHPSLDQLDWQFQRIGFASCALTETGTSSLLDVPVSVCLGTQKLSLSTTNARHTICRCHWLGVTVARSNYHHCKEITDSAHWLDSLLIPIDFFSLPLWKRYFPIPGSFPLMWGVVFTACAVFSLLFSFFFSHGKSW